MINIPAPSAPHHITIEWGGLTRLLDQLHLPQRVTIITDDQVGQLYLEGVHVELAA